MKFGSRMLVNLGACGAKIHREARVWGDCSGISGGDIGPGLKGDISGISGVINQWLSGDATGITIRLSGLETGEVSYVAEKRKQREERKTVPGRRVG